MIKKMTDLDAMEKAMALGEEGRLLAPPNPWVGCVIVNQGILVGEGFTHLVGQPHAEVRALEMAGSKAENSTVFVTLEPCSHHGKTPPCAEALIHAKVTRVVVGLEDPDPRVQGKGIALLRQAGIQVEVGLLSDHIAQSLRPYLHHRRTGKPYCIAKAAVSLDGRIAAEDGSSQWLTGEEARMEVHRLRAKSQAVMIGCGTAIADRPRLNVRSITPLPPHQPLRVILDTEGRVPAEGPLFDSSLAQTLVLTTPKASHDRIYQWQKQGAEVAVLPLSKDGKGVNLSEALSLLGQLGVLQLLIEGGAGIYGEFLREGLLQELQLHVGPRILGKSGLCLFGDWSISQLSEAPILDLQGVKTLGNTVCITYGLG